MVNCGTSGQRLRLFGASNVHIGRLSEKTCGHAAPVTVHEQLASGFPGYHESGKRDTVVLFSWNRGHVGTVKAESELKKTIRLGLCDPIFLRDEWLRLCG